ncbi:MAG: hypothetical protein NZ942_03955, partial [Candidatus Aenigmarchaeota archaeon]|nr:hypothetical protein [Candidatus Aenigmarchaeota archaeon]
MIGLFVVSSKVGRQEEIGKKVKERVHYLTKNIRNLMHFGLLIDLTSAEKISKEVKDKISGCVIVVATGGTERIIRVISSNIKKPTLLWANPFNNSLPSSLEAFSKLKDKIPIKLFYSPINKETINEINSFLNTCEVVEKLEKCRLGCVGEPTKWLLTTKNKKAIEKLGPKV